jgi:hypothetical protein
MFLKILAFPPVTTSTSQRSRREKIMIKWIVYKHTQMQRERERVINISEDKAKINYH